MPRIACLAVVAAVVAAIGLAPGPAAAAKAKRCRAPSGTKVLAKSRQLLVYQDNDLEDVYFFCVRPNGRRTTLLEPAEEFDINSYALVGDVRLAGRFAAFRYHWQRPPCSPANPCVPGQALEGYRVAINRPGNVPVQSDVGESDTTFGLTAGGVLAWLTAVAGGEELHVVGGRFGSQAPGVVIDSGAIDPASFALQGTTLAWTNAGAPKTLSLGG
jgi:hypothetical protein